MLNRALVHCRKDSIHLLWHGHRAFHGFFEVVEKNLGREVRTLQILGVDRLLTLSGCRLVSLRNKMVKAADGKCLVWVVDRSGFVVDWLLGLLVAKLGIG